MDLLRRLFFGKAGKTVLGAGGFNPFGSWEDFSAIINRAGFAYKNLIGQDQGIDRTKAWTPTITFNGASTGITYAANYGSYFKFGKLVICTFAIVLTSKGSATGTARIAGLPFAVNANDYSTTSPMTWANMTSSLYTLFGLAFVNTTTITILGMTAAGTSLVPRDDTDFANNSEIFGSLTYFTT